MTDVLCSCDTCGRPIMRNDARYSPADRTDEDGRAISGRHWQCSEDNNPFARLRETAQGLYKFDDPV